jgi:hypothetical protein
MKLTIAEMDIKIAEREWTERLSTSKDGKIWLDGYGWILGSFIDPNTFWPIMVRDGIWPFATQRSDRSIGYICYRLKNPSLYIHKDPLIAAKLAYMKLHFPELDIELVE